MIDYGNDQDYALYIKECKLRAMGDPEEFAQDVLRVYQIWNAKNAQADRILVKYGLQDLEVGMALRIMTMADAMIADPEEQH